MTLFSDLLLVMFALAFAFMGFVSIILPLRVTTQFGINNLSIDGRNEVRAVYGGFGLMMATSLFIALLHADLRTGICVAIGLALAGMAGGRVLSAIMDRGLGRFPLTYLLIEILGAIGIFYASGIL